MKRPSPCSEGEIGRLHLKGVIRFHDRKAYCAFFVPFSLGNSKKEKKLLEREVKIIIHGDAVIKQMGKAEKEAFMAALLACLLETTTKTERGRDHGT